MLIRKNSCKLAKQANMISTFVDADDRVWWRSFGAHAWGRRPVVHRPPSSCALSPGKHLVAFSLTQCPILIAASRTHFARSPHDLSHGVSVPIALSREDTGAFDCYSWVKNERAFLGSSLLVMSSLVFFVQIVIEFANEGRKCAYFSPLLV